MDKKTVFSRQKNHVTDLNLVERLGLDCQEIPRPERGEHAVSARCESQAAGTA
jgi:hypothetical protein